MAILEKIRKRSLFLILVIGLALFAFVISDLFRNGGFESTKSIVGEVNGESISRDEFIQEVERTSRAYGPSASTIQVVNQVWNRELRNTLLSQQYEELGLSIEKDQIINVVKANPSYASDPTFQNASGVFDEGRFIEFIADLKANNPIAFEQWKQQEQSLVDAAKEQMYFNLIKAGVGATAKEGELNYKLENDKVDIKYVRVPYSSIPDSTVTVSKKDIQSYINDHKDLYEEDASRSIEYVFFEEKPSLEDDQEVLGIVNKLRDKSVEFRDGKNDTIAGLSTTTDVEAFVNEHSDTKYLDKYLFRAQLPVAEADTLLNSEVGYVYGPYKDGEAYKMSRVVAKARIPDSVQSSHILVRFSGALGAGTDVTKTEEEARKSIDSILRLVRNDKEKFAEVADSINPDGTKGRGGDLGWFLYSQITDDTFDRDFSDYLYFNNKGDIDVVKTKFGFHIIRIDDQAAFSDAVKLATIEREVEPSEKTINDLFTTTTKFEIDATSKDFAEAASEKNYVLRPVNKVRALDENLPGLGAQRGIVQWAFSKEAKVGDVRRFNLTNGYAVVRLTGKSKKGVLSAEEASARVLPIIRRHKKAEMIMSKSNATTLEDFAAANGTSVSAASSLDMKSSTIAGAGREPKVIGAAFGLQEGATSSLIEGENGVFMVQVTKKTDAASLDSYSVYLLRQKTDNRNRVNNSVFNALRKSAEIEDNRADFY
ncbi:peptidylprolyl isomerase [Leptobacterium flavescens]|uniref:Periplasmic chaperone PpiD n=1 Tax=Leptobacterium flavescens TaxID=472055 RepID=A0A6P0UQJ1_9FLAO|nr:peptidylprolyl isomerase [Leptobacterium flavescens]NER14782.1 peptidylprolyl isomerase [Leptobacterium flavescens]